MSSIAHLAPKLSLAGWHLYAAEISQVKASAPEAEQLAKRLPENRHGLCDCSLHLACWWWIRKQDPRDDGKDARFLARDLDFSIG